MKATSCRAKTYTVSRTFPPRLAAILIATAIVACMFLVDCGASPTEPSPLRQVAPSATITPTPTPTYVGNFPTPGKTPWPTITPKAGEK